MGFSSSSPYCASDDNASMTALLMMQCRDVHLPTPSQSCWKICTATVPKDCGCVVSLVGAHDYVVNHVESNSVGVHPCIYSN